MISLHRRTGLARALPALALLMLVGCGGGKDPIFGGDVAVARPTVTASAPAPAATNVSIGITAITATFSESIAPLSGGSTFTVVCAAPCASPAGTVSLDSTGRTASFTFNADPLAPLTKALSRSP
ncbi:MAG: Ig-like domain-containing protein [Gammaproteobacteria bacterium]